MYVAVNPARALGREASGAQRSRCDPAAGRMLACVKCALLIGLASALQSILAFWCERRQDGCGWWHCTHKLRALLCATQQDHLTALELRFGCSKQVRVHLHGIQVAFCPAAACTCHSVQRQAAGSACTWQVYLNSVTGSGTDAQARTGNSLATCDAAHPINHATCDMCTTAYRAGECSIRLQTHSAGFVKPNWK